MLWAASLARMHRRGGGAAKNYYNSPSTRPLQAAVAVPFVCVWLSACVCVPVLVYAQSASILVSLRRLLCACLKVPIIVNPSTPVQIQLLHVWIVGPDSMTTTFGNSNAVCNWKLWLPRPRYKTSQGRFFDLKAKCLLFLFKNKMDIYVYIHTQIVKTLYIYFW